MNPSPSSVVWKAAAAVENADQNYKTAMRRWAKEQEKPVPVTPYEELEAC